MERVYIEWNLEKQWNPLPYLWSDGIHIIPLIRTLYAICQWYRLSFRIRSHWSVTQPFRSRSEQHSSRRKTLVTAKLHRLELKKALLDFYRVGHLLWDIGLVDFVRSTMLPCCPASSAKLTSGHTELGRQWNIKNKVNPTQVLEEMPHPVYPLNVS